MTQRALYLALTLLLIPLSTQAEPIPAEVLAKDYQACLGKIAADPNGTKREKEVYCGCVRDKIAATWDLKTYTDVAQQAASGSQAGMMQMETFAADCIMKSLGGKP